MHRETKQNWEIESQRRHGPNVLSCILVSGSQRTPLVGVHFPPNSLADLPHLTEALTRFPNNRPVVLGDLNVDLQHDDMDDRCSQVAATLATHGLEDLSPHFSQRKSF